MSYAQDLKHAMSEREPQKNCCRKAYLNGFLISSACAEERNVIVRLSGSHIVEVFQSLVEKVLHTTCLITPCRGGGETYEICFTSSSASKYLQELEENEDVATLSLRCEECKKWFLRGLFLASGKVLDPEVDFRMELTPRYHLARIAEYLTSVKLKPLLTTRRGTQILFFRRGELIGDFFGMMGEMEIYFSFQDAFFKKELGNLTNRQNNCMVSNIMRSVKGSGELIDLLTRMKAQNKLSLLPDDLRSTAELRLAYPDYTLPRLASVSVPPLTKSGLNHRLTRILEIARKLDF